MEGLGSMHHTVEGVVANSSTSQAPSRFYPAELHHIKRLFIQEQYHKCINLCRDLLAIVKDESSARPLQDTFVLFYMASAHDEMARLMHLDSKARSPSFDAAEFFYSKALESLPSLDEAHTLITNATVQNQEDDAISNSNSDLDSASQREESDSTLRPPDSPAMSASSFVDHSDSHQRTTSDGSIEAPGSENEDLESQQGFEQIMTPSRLERDYSKMSLLEATPPERKSMTHGLLKPIRLGSPPKQFHVPPSLPYSGQYRPHLPRLNTKPSRYAPKLDIASARWSQFSSPEPGEPVSPLGPDEIASDTSTISPVSPTTPTIPSPILRSSDIDDDVSDMEDDDGIVDDTEGHSEGDYEEFVEDHGESHSEASFEYRYVDGGHFQDSIQDLQTQLRKHIILVQEARKCFQQVQARKRSAKYLSPAIEFDPDQASTGSRKRRDSAKSDFRSAQNRDAFIPANVRANELQERIRVNRERQWKRKRFEPQRYRDLCELALADL